MACQPKNNDDTDSAQKDSTTKGVFMLQPAKVGLLPYSKTLQDSTDMAIVKTIFNEASLEGEYWKVSKAQLENDTALVSKFNRFFKQSNDYDGDKFLVKVDHKSVMTESNGTQRLFTYLSITFEGNDCHVCAPLVGTGFWNQVKGSWELDHFRIFDHTGKYGIAPSAEVVEIKKDEWALDLGIADIHMGYYSEYMFLVHPKQEYKSIFSTSTHLDNSGACDTDGSDNTFGKCFEYDLKYTIQKSAKDYYTIETHKTGSEKDYDKDIIVENIDEKKIHTFHFGKYEEKK
ncbi:MAG: hypothetical protein ACPG5P_07180 [Saprospiraceae bacterium]